MQKSVCQSCKSLILGLVLILCVGSFDVYSNQNVSPSGANDKAAIITGSNRGQGLGWVKYFLKEGYTVVATAREPEAAKELKELKQQYKDQLLIEKLDVTSEEDMAALGAKLKKGNIKFDIAVSNAGVTVHEDFGEWTSKSFEINYKVNTMGAAFFAQMVAPYLKDGAKLVQLSSGAGSIASQKNSSSLDPYSISKAGLNMLTKKLAIRLADRQIIVVSISPGGVNTDMNPEGKLSVTEAIDIMAKTISKLTIENSGTFINNYGKVMPW